jgi:hypothetical protein
MIYDEIYAVTLLFIMLCCFNTQRNVLQFLPMNMKNCRKNLPISVNLTFTNGTIEKFEAFGSVNVSEELNNLDASSEIFKCSFDMKSCDRYPTPAVTDVCGRIDRKTVFYAAALEAIEPKFVCPLKVGVYNVRKVLIDFPSVLTILPLEKYVWIAKFKYIDAKSRNAKACVNFEAKFLRKRIKN